MDPQNDFVTGSLAVPDAQKAMETFNQFATEFGGLEQYDKILVTIDSHPINHISFKSQGGIFPPHCVQHTIGAAICPEVENALSKNTNVQYFTKGSVQNKEEFSIFKSENGSKLSESANFFRDTEIHVMGIAGDYCVHDTIEDILAGYSAEIASRITVLKDFIASIDGGAKLKNLVEKYGIKII